MSRTPALPSWSPGGTGGKWGVIYDDCYHRVGVVRWNVQRAVGERERRQGDGGALSITVSLPIAPDQAVGISHKMSGGGCG